MQRCYRCHHYFKKPIYLRHLASFIQLNEQVLLQVFRPIEHIFIQLLIKSLNIGVIEIHTGLIIVLL